MADSIFAIEGDGFVLMCASTNQTRSIMVIKSDGESKIMHLDSHKLLGSSGDNGDRSNFTEFIQKNVALYEIRCGYQLDMNECANFTRDEMAKSIRSHPYQCNMLLGGVDVPPQGSAEPARPSLYWIDYMGSMQRLPFGAQGYAGHFLLGLFDRVYKPNMNEEEAVHVMRKCIEQLNERFVLQSAHYEMKIVDKDGIRTLQ